VNIGARVGPGPRRGKLALGSRARSRAGSTDTTSGAPPEQPISYLSWRRPASEGPRSVFAPGAGSSSLRQKPPAAGERGTACRRQFALCLAIFWRGIGKPARTCGTSPRREYGSSASGLPPYAGCRAAASTSPLMTRARAERDREIGLLRAALPSMQCPRRASNQGSEHGLFPCYPVEERLHWQVRSTLTRVSARVRSTLTRASARAGRRVTRHPGRC
jgi:hypothetical protein